MSKQLFDHSDDDEGDVKLKTNNDYAKQYDNWRQKEEFNKLKTKYGEHFGKTNDVDTSSSSSSDDDEDELELDDRMEIEFLRTLSKVKSKDPTIYEGETRFFKDMLIDASKKSNKPKEKPMYINDFERKLLMETGGKIPSDDDDNQAKTKPSFTYVNEQNEIKNELKTALEALDEDGDDWQNLCKKRVKTNEELEREEADYKQWLLGKTEAMKDKSTEEELKPLKEFWTNKKLNDEEKFLRDFILNKRFLKTEDSSYVPTYDEICEESDEELNRQETFETKYNYRFEEPDAEFIKRYPRTMANSLRRTDDRRKTKRAEVKERKTREKEQKMADLRRAQELKRKEIEAKLARLRAVTGNNEDERGFDRLLEDLDDDFDPDRYDSNMRELFDDGYYNKGGDDVDVEKPEFSDLDEELEIERWDKLEDGHLSVKRSKDNDSTNEEQDEPHCEDPDFNMDWDYDPNAPSPSLSNAVDGGRRKKRKRKSKFAQIVSEPKPIFDPAAKTYDQYLEEYYKLDCEDIIGDVPCRFKYRTVVPNSFGLTIEEILSAKDRELNKWCSLKKSVQYRPDEVERYEVMAYQKKATNEPLKRRILPSLYQKEEDVEEKGEQHEKEDQKLVGGLQKKVNKKKRKNEPNKFGKVDEQKFEELDSKGEESVKKISKKRAAVEEVATIEQHEMKKRKWKSSQLLSVSGEANQDKKGEVKKGQKKPFKNGGMSKKNQNNTSHNTEISDSRLCAFGIKPKKFKNKLRFAGGAYATKRIKKH